MTQVLVTGASRGIGAAVARRLAASGHDLVLWARSFEGLATTAADVRNAGGRATTEVVDVGDPHEVAAAATALDDLVGVVLNAGSGRWVPIDELTLDDWNHTIRTNLDGSYHVLRAAVPLLRGRKHGLIVGILSDAVLHPLVGRAAYTASKAGLAALLEVVRREVRADNIRVSAVLPSRVDTHFRGSHACAAPGTREGALAASDVADVVGALFDLPDHIEMRELRLAAMTSTYGSFPERVT